MIRFKIIGGDYLDLPDDFGFSFQYNNSIFAFENMALSRSSEFEVPKTPKNEQILSFSSDPSKSGVGVRKFKYAELHYSGGKITGRLYFGKYANGNYSCIFVYGELLALKEAGDKKLSEIFGNLTYYSQVASHNIQSAYSSSGGLSVFGFVKYKNGIADANKLTTHFNMMPTASLKSLTDIAANKFNMTIGYSSGIANNAQYALGLILATNKAGPILTSGTAIGVPNSTLSFTGISPYFVVGNQGFAWVDKFGNGKKKVQLIKCLVAAIDCTIKFDNAYPSACVITNSGNTFLSTGVVSGRAYKTIVAGETITVKKGTTIAFASIADYWFSDYFFRNYNDSVNLSFKIYSGEAETVDYNETYYLRDNLPDVTLIDLLKVYANIFRCGLDYDPVANKINFFNYSFDKSAATPIDDIIIGVKSVERKFLNYARRNIIEFNSEDYVKEPYKFSYAIDSDLVETEKTLYKVPFSEGNRGLNSDVEISDFELASPYKKTCKTPTICVGSKTSGQNYLKHIGYLYENWSVPDNLTPIIQNSTTMVVQVRMNVKDFLSIKNKDTFKYRGKAYCCTNATHSGNFAELTLVRLD